MTVEARAMNGTQTFQSVRLAEFYSAETGRRGRREEFPLGAQATRPVFLWS
jgi:hypothetical protein